MIQSKYIQNKKENQISFGLSELIWYKVHIFNFCKILIHFQNNFGLVYSYLYNNNNNNNTFYL